MFKKYLPVLAGLSAVCRNWTHVLAARYIPGISVRAIKLYDGTVFTSKGSPKGAELSILAEIWHQQAYNPPFFEIHPDNVVIDVGANKGYFTVYAAKRAREVHAFEPVSFIFSALQKNVEANNLRNVKLNRAAVASATGTLTMHLSKDNSGGHSAFSGQGFDGEEAVPTVSLEEYCRREGIQTVDLLKMDCEGGEYDIFPPMSPEFFKKIRRITMEYHEVGGHRYSEIGDKLKANNFLVTADERRGYLFALNRSSL